MSEFKDYQIRQADAALRAANKGNGFLDAFKCYEIMKDIGPHPEYMREILMEDLHLFARRGSSMLLLEEGRKAARMGLRRYLLRRDLGKKMKWLKECGETGRLLYAVIAAIITYILMKIL
jgi:hypothetical protein